MNTKTETKKPAEAIAQPAASKGELVPTTVKLRLPYPKAACEYAGIDVRQFKVLIDDIWPGAQSLEAICGALAYCAHRKLDPMKRVVHIVPMWKRDGAGYDDQGKPKGKMVETFWPGIAELRTTATRTGIYAGKDAAEFGETIEQTFNNEYKGETETVTVKFPEWCRVTVYKLVHEQRCAFVGPKVYWLESYATKSRFSDIPNEMWADRRSGQLEKCAEAAALRAAFPEELGNEYAAEEMHGRVIEGVKLPTDEPPVPVAGTLRSAFAEGREDQNSSEATSGKTARKTSNRKPRQEKTVDKPAGEQGKKEPETPLARGLRLLAMCKTVDDVSDLHQAIAEELKDPELEKWDGSCRDRSAELNPANNG